MDRRLLALGVVWVLGNGSQHTSQWTSPLLAGAVVALLGAVLLTRQGRHRAAVLATVITLVVFVEGAVTAMVVAEGHERFGKRPVWNPLFEAVPRSGKDADVWPDARTTVSAVNPAGSSKWIAPNDPMLLGGQGIGYYSSLMPRVTTSALRPLGVNWAAYGRSIIDTPDQGRDAILGISTRVGITEAEGVYLERGGSAPIVTVRQLPVLTDNVFRNRNEFAGSEAYTFPLTEVLSGKGTTVPVGIGGYRLPGSLERPGAVLRASCPAGAGVHLTAPVHGRGAQTDGQPPVEILPAARANREQSSARHSSTWVLLQQATSWLTSTAARRSSCPQSLWPATPRSHGRRGSGPPAVGRHCHCGRAHLHRDVEGGCRRQRHGTRPCSTGLAVPRRWPVAGGPTRPSRSSRSTCAAHLSSSAPSRPPRVRLGAVLGLLGC